ncbi:MAG TPA: HAMP domain-containing protein [Azospirillaceae bacterium]|nr:HAMP domain-containing protein [Azospirillaceae bacterium]
MKLKIKLGLRGLILAMVVPALLVVTVAMGVLIYNQIYRTIIAGFDRQLTAASSVSASFIDGDLHQRLFEDTKKPDFSAEAMEASDDFLHYVVAMRRIREELRLTFLYTQVLTGGLDIVYVFDSNTDEDHTPPGYKDELPADDADNIRRVLEEKTVYVSGIKQWELWGLLKSGYAPILDSSGAPVAMAGAEHDITSIQQKTRIALVNVGAAGALALIASIAIAVAVAGKLAEPIRRLTLASFQVAAGRYGHQVSVTGPKELNQLATTFNTMSVWLQEKLTKVNDANLEAERHRRRQELIRVLGERADSGPETELFAALRQGGIDCGPSVSGWAGGERVGVAWFAEGGGNGLQAVVRRLQIAHVVTRVLASHGEDGARVLERLQDLLGSEVYAVAVHDFARATLYLAATKPVFVQGVMADGGVGLVESVTGAHRRTLPAGGGFVITDAQIDDPGEGLAAAGARDLPAIVAGLRDNAVRRIAELPWDAEAREIVAVLAFRRAEVGSTALDEAAA